MTKARSSQKIWRAYPLFGVADGAVMVLNRDGCVRIRRSKNTRDSSLYAVKCVCIYWCDPADMQINPACHIDLLSSNRQAKNQPRNYILTDMVSIIKYYF